MRKRSIESGMIFGNLIVIGPSDKYTDTTLHWECLCKCGKTTYPLARDLNKGNSRSCGQKGCRADKRIRHKKEKNDKKEVREQHELIKDFYWKRVLKNAEQRGMEVTISLEYAAELFYKQEWKCIFTGVDLQFANIFSEKSTASLDRIDSSLGYCENNLQWVHKSINRMKMNLPDDEFIDWCALVYLNRKT